MTEALQVVTTTESQAEAEALAGALVLARNTSQSSVDAFIESSTVTAAAGITVGADDRSTIRAAAPR